ncbi:probable aminotransferase TAT2 [Diospyros lotus]|uniref:probable aminotransferase TAT2 n=1 Tax=Diospyros lotus TaxID=55363 RepID=UPI00224F4CFE|nr:probable aminotransferase TAT2 [Diospyros lotus]
MSLNCENSFLIKKQEIRLHRNTTSQSGEPHAPEPPSVKHIGYMLSRTRWKQSNDDNYTNTYDNKNIVLLFVKGAVPHILEKTTEDFFLKIRNMLREAANICYDRLKEIPCVTCPHRPEGAMSTIVKLDLSLLEDISDDLDFCVKLAKEESVIVLPGSAMGLKNWLRVTFSVEPSLLEDGLLRVKTFYLRHARKK